MEQNTFGKMQSLEEIEENGYSDAHDGGDTIRPQTVEYSSSWLNFLIVLCLLIAWYFPVKILISHWIWPSVDRGPQDAYEFVALTYDGVSDKPNEVSPKQFEDQLDSMVEAGYNPITLEEVRNLYEKGDPLPRKALLLSFDHSRKSSFFDTRSAIRRAGWYATMFLWAKPIEEMDRATLLWPYLQAMLRGKSWQVSAQSYNGFEHVLSSPQGDTGYFMTTPKWLPEEERYETLEEFRARLTRDHERCISLIQNELGVTPIAYAYPFGDFGQFKASTTVIRAINLALVECNYDLGFLTGNLALNTRHSDPRRLNRLLVDENWDGEKLVSYLEKCWPVDNPAQRSNQASELPWIVDWGDMEQTPAGDINLFAPHDTTGAKMWLAGSDLNKDFYAKVAFRLEQGQMGLYLRATPDGESYVYLGIDSGGGVWLRQFRTGEKDEEIPEDKYVRNTGIWLRQKEVSSERFTLASAQVSLDPQTEHTVEVYLRGNLLFARLDGGHVFKQRIMLRGEQKPGMFGLSIWDPVDGNASVFIDSVELHQQDKAMLCWESGNEDYEPYMFQWVHDNAYRLTDISPKWMTVDSLGQTQFANIDFDTYSLMARINHLNLYPEITIDDQNDLSRITPKFLKAEMSKTKADGVFLDMEGIVAPTASRIINWIRSIGKTLQDQGLDIVINLPRELETRTSMLSILSIIPNSKLVLAEDSEIAEDPKLKNKPIVKKEKLDPPQDSSELPLFYEIEGIAAGTPEETTEAKIDRLNAEGMAAYRDGDYAQAINLWKEWLEIETGNPKAMMLIGDAQVRNGNLEAGLAYYNQSLEIDPGQISLELRRIKLLDSMGMKEDAVESLNLYARLFPENADILLAQAEWLEENNRKEETIEVAKKVVEIEPENLKALTLIFRYSENEEDRRNALQTMVELGKKPVHQIALGNLIWDYQLLTLPGSGPLMELATEVATTTEDPRIREVYKRLRPQYSSVQENFENGKLSDQWWVTGGKAEGAPGRIVMDASPTHSEISLKMLGSLHIRNSYIEATVGNVNGAFWLYARRSSNHIARFGFIDGELYLQVWRNGHLVSERSKSWQPPAKPVTLRVEICADGLIGYVDGEIAFTPYLHMPRNLGPGWIGIAANNKELGSAAATLYNIAAGPTPTRIALLSPTSSDSETDRQLQSIRRTGTVLMAICPDWFAMDTAGNWIDKFDSDKQLYTLFARYHRFWIMPAVDVQSQEAVTLAQLRNRSEQYKTNGFLLMMDTWPTDEWIDEMNRKLKNSDLKLLVGQIDGETDVIKLMGLGGGRNLVSSTGKPQIIQLTIGDPAASAQETSKDKPLALKL